MENILISLNENRFENQKNGFLRHLPAIQSIVDKYNELGYGTLTNEEFYQLFKNPKEFIFDKITNESTSSLLGFEIHKHKALDLIKLPDPVVSLLTEIETEITALKYNEIYEAESVSVNVLNSVFELDSNSKVQLKEEKISQLKEQNSSYLTSNRAQKMYAFAQTVLTAIKEYQIGNEFQHNPDGMSGVIKTLFETRNNNPFCLNVKRLLEYNNETAIVRY